MSYWEERIRKIKKRGPQTRAGKIAIARDEVENWEQAIKFYIRFSELYPDDKYWKDQIERVTENKKKAQDHFNEVRNG